MNSLNITNNIMRKNRIFAKKSFGQNFLVDDEILSSIVSESDVHENDLVIEIGPGLGNLTEYILATGAQVIAFEIDPDMIGILQERFDKKDNLRLEKQDILKVDLNEYIGTNKVKVIANLPYYITTPIIFKLLEYKDKIDTITVMVQKEVADRIISAPHSKDYGVLTININYIANVTKLFNVPNSSFVPAPNVTSSVIKIVPDEKKEQDLGLKDEKIFKELVKKAFASRRKKLANSLINVGIEGLSKNEIEEIIESTGLNINCRAEELSITEYAKLANVIYEKTNKMN